jgi:hypothetical protein
VSDNLELDLLTPSVVCAKVQADNERCYASWVSLCDLCRHRAIQRSWYRISAFTPLHFRIMPGLVAISLPRPIFVTASSARKVCLRCLADDASTVANLNTEIRPFAVFGEPDSGRSYVPPEHARNPRIPKPLMLWVVEVLRRVH